MAAQQTYFGEAADPKTRACDWCGAPGCKAIELRKPGKKVCGTGQFLYPCSRHVSVAQKQAEAIRTPIKRDKS